jgi:hypothetical protein
MPEIVSDLFCRPAITCFPNLESRNLNGLTLILFLPRARARARALRQQELRLPALPAALPSRLLTGLRNPL